MSNPFASLQKTFGSAINIANTVKKSIDTVSAFADNPLGFMKGIRSLNLPTDAMPTFKSRTGATVKTPRGENDWRVSLSIPPIMQGMTSDLLAPLGRTNNRMIFPFTPSIIFSHSASYNALQPTHSNYPFYNYQSSAVDAITIAGDFFVENNIDAQYWISAVTYLRTVTKMFYGNGANVGNPPPIIKLNGYGEFVFNEVPCVVTSFNIDLPQDVDYIKAVMDSTESSDPFGDPTTISGPATWVPSQSLISVTVQPIYSRATQSEFNLNDFVSGDLITRGII
tara:strand:+ start:3112 stop:3954 length:843 start_codon:yes stop_codon:yes gene_type:complete